MPLGFFDESVDPLHWFDNDLSPGGWFDKDFFEAFGGEGGGGGESGGGGSSGGGGGTTPSGPLTTTRVSLPPGVRMTASLLKQIMDQCGTCNPCGSGSGGSGSGSGSGGSGSGSGGGGGLNSCCGCDVFPDTLTISITIGCIPKTRTLTLSKSLAQSECTTPPSSAINVEYLGSTAPVVTEGSFSDTNCVSGAGVISDSAVDDQYVVGLYCVRCNDTPPYVYKWFITITASNIAATTHQSLVEYYNEISAPATCSPLTFATVSKTIVCENNKTSNGVCNSQNLYNEPYVGYSYCVGSSFSFDISE